jgi:hypothetical protein
MFAKGRQCSPIELRQGQPGVGCPQGKMMGGADRSAYGTTLIAAFGKPSDEILQRWTCGALPVPSQRVGVFEISCQHAALLQLAP